MDPDSEYRLQNIHVLLANRQRVQCHRRRRWVQGRQHLRNASASQRLLAEPQETDTRITCSSVSGRISSTRVTWYATVMPRHTFMQASQATLLLQCVQTTTAHHLLTGICTAPASRASAVPANAVGDQSALIAALQARHPNRGPVGSSHPGMASAVTVALPPPGMPMPPQPPGDATVSVLPPLGMPVPPRSLGYATGIQQRQHNMHVDMQQRHYDDDLVQQAAA